MLLLKASKIAVIMRDIAEHDNLGAALGRSLQKDDAQVSTPTEGE